MQLPWKTKGIVLTAPFSRDVDDTVRFIDEYLAKHGCNLLVLQVRYRYQFKRHPECQGYDPLSEADIKKIVAVCRKNNIKLVPKINAAGHQSGLPNTPDDSILHGHSVAMNEPIESAQMCIRDGLLRAYPDFDEQRGVDRVKYSRNICFSNPLVKIILFDLMDELLEVFEADTIHVGCDEVFNIGLCPECSKKTNDVLFGDWVNAIYDHVSAKGAKVMIWSDRFLNSEETGYDAYQASQNGTDKCIDNVPKDLLICDWHYEGSEEYKSVDVFAEHGFKMLLSPSFYSTEYVMQFINYAKAHDKGHIEGVLATTWCSSGELARFILDDVRREPAWRAIDGSREVLKLIFE